jgi:hypothetical protein
MNKWLFNILIGFCSILLCRNGTLAQDKVILLNGDTLNVTIPADPRKETDLSNASIGRMNDYGFKSVVIIYPNDSIRIQRPDQIKGYIREKKGNYLGAGYFESRMINEKQIGYKRDNLRSVFLQRVNLHKDLTIWFYREELGDPMPQFYFLIEVKGKEFTSLVTTMKEWKLWAINYPPLGEITHGHPKTKKNNLKVGPFFSYLVEIIDTYKQKYPSPPTPHP